MGVVSESVYSRIVYLSAVCFCFPQEFSLIEKRELAPLQELMERLIK